MVCMASWVMQIKPVPLLWPHCQIFRFVPCSMKFYLRVQNVKNTIRELALNLWLRVKDINLESQWLSFKWNHYKEWQSSVKALSVTSLRDWKLLVYKACLPKIGAIIRKVSHQLVGLALRNSQKSVRLRILSSCSTWYLERVRNALYCLHQEALHLGVYS